MASHWRLVALLLFLASGSRNALRAAVGHPLLVTQVPVATGGPSEPGPAQGVAPGFFDKARLVLVEPGGNVRLLAAGFSAACDPNLHYDGDRILFAGKKSQNDSWAIWETRLAGGEPRRVVEAGQDCRNPVYLSSLFTLNSPQPWYTIAYVGRDPTLDERGLGAVLPARSP